MNSFEEIARLKNLVAEKVKVIGIMEKERTAMQKLHREYAKERTDQDSMEAEYAERMRRVNQDLRVAKGLMLMHMHHAKCGSNSEEERTLECHLLKIA
jgi:hypothetical protein